MKLFPMLKIGICIIFFVAMNGICTTSYAQETSVKVDPYKLLFGYLGATVEQQIGPKYSIRGEAVQYFSTRDFSYYGRCGGSSIEATFRYYLRHKKGGLRGLYLSPGINLSSDCRNTIESSGGLVLATGDFGFQAIGKGGFTFDIFIGTGIILSGIFLSDGVARGGIAFGYTFGEIIGSKE